jgi:hypothetical protein
MAGQQLLALGRGDEIRNGLRDEARQLGPLALDGVEQPCVRDRDRRLVGERLDELDLFVGERPCLEPGDPDHADELLVEERRDAEERAQAADLASPPCVLGICENVRDVDRAPRQRNPADARPPVRHVRMRALVLRLLA